MAGIVGARIAGATRVIKGGDVRGRREAVMRVFLFVLATLLVIALGALEVVASRSVPLTMVP
jgi:hypothetical protein